MSTWSFHSIVGWPFTPLGRLRQAQRDPVRTQLRLLRKLLKQAAPTHWGQEHAFAEVLRYKDGLNAFQDRVPLCGYDELRMYVDRVRDGEADVLWPGQTRHFAVSGGTVSSGRLIPVSPSMLRVMARCNLTPGLQYLSQSGRAGFLGGKVLSVPGGISEVDGRPGMLVGEVSGLMANAVPRVLARHFQAIPSSLMLLEDWESKLHQVAAHTAGQDIRALIMVPSWAPLLFEAVLAHAADQRGSPPESIRDLWPHLQVFFTGGVALRAYRPLLEQYVGRDVDFIESYSASEGFFAFQDDVKAPDLLLHIDSGVFYEFVRLEDLDLDQPRRYTLADVVPGVDYALYVSTCSGLWGYGVQDVVRFTSTRPPRLCVVGRTATMLDAYGEALHADEVEQALSTAARLTRAQCLHHHITYASPIGAIPRHEWLIEFAHPPEDPEAFATICDHYLQEHNRHYRIRREPGALGVPELTVLPEGTCISYLRRTRDRLMAQTKLLSMSSERDVAEGLLDVTFSRVRR